VLAVAHIVVSNCFALSDGKKPEIGLIAYCSIVNPGPQVMDFSDQNATELVPQPTNLAVSYFHSSLEDIQLGEKYLDVNLNIYLIYCT